MVLVTALVLETDPTMMVSEFLINVEYMRAMLGTRMLFMGSRYYGGQSRMDICPLTTSPLK